MYPSPWLCQVQDSGDCVYHAAALLHLLVAGFGIATAFPAKHRYAIIVSLLSHSTTTTTAWQFSLNVNHVFLWHPDAWVLHFRKHVVS